MRVWSNLLAAVFIVCQFIGQSPAATGGSSTVSRDTAGAIARCTTAASCSATIPTVLTGDAGFLSCASLASAVTWTTPSGWTVVPNTTQNVSAPSTIMFERIMASSDSATTVACTPSATTTITAVVFSYKGTVSSGETTDVNHTQHNAAGTTGACQDAGVTPTLTTDMLVFVCANNNTTTYSAWTNANSLALTQYFSSSGQGAADVLLSNANATGLNSATNSTSIVTEGTSLTVKAGTSGTAGVPTLHMPDFSNPEGIT